MRGCALAAGAVRDFDVALVADYAFQGGSSGNCGGVGTAGGFGAALVTVTAVDPQASGYLAVFPFGETPQVTEGIPFTAGRSMSITVPVKLDQTGAIAEMSVSATAGTHVTLDVVGYFREPRQASSGLNCAATAPTTVTIAPGSAGSATAPGCASGLQAVATNCASASSQLPIYFGSGGVCSAQNNGASSATLEASQMCCGPTALQEPVIPPLEQIDPPQLTLSKSASAGPWGVGVPASYTLSLSNTGWGPTTAVSTIIDTIPAGLTIGALPGDCTRVGQTVTCTVAAGLAVSDSRSFVIPVTPTLAAGPSVTNTATVSGGGDLTSPSSASCPVSAGPTAINAPQLTMSKSASASPWTVGVAASYTLQVQNTGTAATTAAATVTDTIPSGLTIGTLPAACTSASQTVTCTIGAGLATGDSASFVIPVTPTLAAGASVTNTATVSGGGDPTCPADARCTSSAGPTTVNAPSPSVSISVSPAAVSEDGASNLTYTVTRSLNLASPTVVNITTGGTATSGVDYTGGVATVTILAGATTATINIDPSVDGMVEPDETVTLTIAPGSGYTVGTPSSATGTILNDDDPCTGFTFPHTLVGADNTARVANLRLAIQCANANSTADLIDLNGESAILTDAFASYSGATGLPQITSVIRLRNGSIVRNGAAPQFRILAMNATADLTLEQMNLQGGRLGSLEDGGAILNNSGTLTLQNTFVSNCQAGFSGAIYHENAALRIVNSVVSANTTDSLGVITNAGGSVTILDSTFAGNTQTTASSSAGVIYNASGTVTIAGSVFANNSTAGPAGAIQNFGGTVHIANSAFTGNSATSFAGALFNNNGTVTVANSRITGNSAGNRGGGLYAQGGSLAVSNSTVAGNNAPTDGGITIASGTSTLVNSILWGNSSAGTLTGTAVSYSIVQGGVAGNGNLDVDPLFVAPAPPASAPTSSGDYRLRSYSPAADAGNNAAVPIDTLDVNGNANTSEEAPDLDGNPRRYNDSGIVDTGLGTAPVVDLGAYERQFDSVALSIDDISLTEGNSGTTNAVFTVTLSAASSQTVTANFATADGTASAPSDYASSSGVLSFTPGQTSQTITVSVVGDSVVETNETFLVNLSSPTNAGIRDAQGVGTIIDDDSVPQLTMTKSASPAPWIVGVPASYTLQVQNTGTAATTAAATITDTIPAGLTIGTLPAGCTRAGQTVTCTIAAGMATSGSASFVIPVTPTVAAGASVTNTATATGAGDPSCPAAARCSSTAGPTPVQAAVIDAVDDTGTVANGASGGTAVPNVLVNDTLDGAPATLANVTVTQVSTSNPNITLNPASGAVSVASATPAGTYTVVYQICEQLNPTNCDTSSVAVTVGAAVIDAVDDSGTVVANGIGGVAVSNVLANDTLNAAPATLATVDLSQMSTSDPNLSLNLSTGQAVVAPAIPAGTHTLVYRICEQLNPTNCDTATVTVNALALPVLSVSSPSQPEGNASTSLMNFVVSIPAPFAYTVGFSASTANGTATTGDNDYVALPQTPFSITAGQTSVTIPVTINGDTVFEGNESFSLVINGVSNATPSSLTGTGTIEEDDQQPTTTLITHRAPTTTVVGRSYTVDVTVTAQSLSPLGSVTVSDGSANCTAALVAGTAPTSTMSCSLASTTAGTKTLTASYTASTTAFGNSSGTASHVVTAATTTIGVSGPARSRTNQPTAFSFALAVTAPGGGTPTGTVTLSSGTSSCTTTLPATSCNLSFGALGSRTVSASYAGNSNYLASSSSGAGNTQTLVYALADVSVTKTEPEGSYEPGQLVVYTVQVRNAGPDAAAQVRVQDMVPAGLAAVTWTCDASSGALCAPESGSGDLDQLLASLPVGALWNYTFFGTVNGSPEQIVNTATLTLPSDTTVEDQNAGNNSASVTSLLQSLFADGFESPLVSGPEGSVRMPTALLAPVLDEVARVVFKLDDKHGEAARVYARLRLGTVEYALATRGANGRWTLGAWTGYALEPVLSWQARLEADAWQLTRVELR
ncbi:MAG: Calx-beta domain-containing protein [Lysobacterales bacterium]